MNKKYVVAAGLAIFAFLSVIVHRANEVVKRQVASKSEFQKSLCIAVAVGLAVHVPFVIFLLQSERLWLRFALATPSPAPGVSQCSTMLVLHSAICLKLSLQVIVHS